MAPKLELVGEVVPPASLGDVPEPLDDQRAVPPGAMHRVVLGRLTSLQVRKIADLISNCSVVSWVSMGTWR